MEDVSEGMLFELGGRYEWESVVSARWKVWVDGLLILAWIRNKYVEQRKERQQTLVSFAWQLPLTNSSVL